MGSAEDREARIREDQCVARNAPVALVEIAHRVFNSAADGGPLPSDGKSRWRHQCGHAAVMLASALERSGVEEVYVVHGYPFGQGGECEGIRYWHAWVERGSFVFDLTVTFRAFRRDEYYAQGDIEEPGRSTHRYSLWNVRRSMRALDTYGPWGKGESRLTLPTGRV